VFAIGDVIGHPCLAHKATHEAIMCIEYIAVRDGIFSCSGNIDNSVDNTGVSDKSGEANFGKSNANDWYSKYLYDQFSHTFDKALNQSSSVYNSQMFDKVSGTKYIL
jgi:hypothetical protein